MQVFKLLGAFLGPLIQILFVKRLARGEVNVGETLESTQATLRILVLHGDLFRGDLEELVRYPGVELFILDVRVQYFLKKLFHGKNISALHYYRDLRDGANNAKRKIGQSFIHGVLTALLSNLKISTVMTANVRYVEDLDWCISAESVGVPWVVLYREGLLMFPRAIEGSKRRHELFGRFYGSHIVVQNEIVKEMFIESGFARCEHISVCGAPRAERLKREMDVIASIPRGAPTVLVLFFSPGRYQSASTDNLGTRPPGIPTSLFSRFMTEIISMSLDYPEIKFCIKPKKNDLGIQAFYDLLSEKQQQIDDLSNIQINDQIDFYQALASAHVVCGLQTTAVLEAAAVGKPVIVPFFKEYRDSDWSLRFGYKNHLDLFDVPEDEGQTREMIIQGLTRWAPTEELLQQRRALFSKWISPMEGDSAAATISVIRQVCQERISSDAKFS